MPENENNHDQLFRTIIFSTLVSAAVLGILGGLALWLL